MSPSRRQNLHRYRRRRRPRESVCFACRPHFCLLEVQMHSRVGSSSFHRGRFRSSLFSACETVSSAAAGVSETEGSLHLDSLEHEGVVNVCTWASGAPPLLIHGTPGRSCHAEGRSLCHIAWGRPGPAWEMRARVLRSPRSGASPPRKRARQPALSGAQPGLCSPSLSQVLVSILTARPLWLEVILAEAR